MMENNNEQSTNIKSPNLHILKSLQDAELLLNKEIPNLSFHFTNDKAGMTGLNREEINKIIYESTKDSAITKKKIEEFERIKLLVDEYKIKLDGLKKNEILYEQNRRLAENRIRELKKERSLDRVWMHIDMDMFYAAVEIKDRPELANHPVAVGDERMVSTSNYIARKFGIRSAMPGFIAKRLCEELVFIKPNFYKYESDSKIIMGILKDYDPDIDVRGLDEAYLDLTHYCKLNYINTQNEISDLISEIKKKISDQTSLTASCGIASNKMLAKICSDIQKPNGLYILGNNTNEIESFMLDLKVRKIPSVGEKLEKKLNLMGIYTCKDVIDRQVDLFHLFSENQFDFLLSSAFGIGSSYHEDVREGIPKSISCSETFRVTNDIEFITKQFYSLCKKLFVNMIEQSVIGKTLTVEITDKNEKHSAKSLSLTKRFETESEILNNGWNILKSMIEGTAIRMIRLKISSLQQVNPEVLKKKEENKIKHWIGKLNDNPGEVPVKTRSKSMKTGNSINNDYSNTSSNQYLVVNNLNAQNEKEKRNFSATKMQLCKTTPHITKKFKTIDQLFGNMVNEKKKNPEVNKNIIREIPTSPIATKSSSASNQNLKRKSKNNINSSNKRKRNKKVIETFASDKLMTGPLDKFVKNVNNK